MNKISHRGQLQGWDEGEGAMQRVLPQKTVSSSRRLSSVCPAVGSQTQGTEGFVPLG